MAINKLLIDTTFDPPCFCRTIPLKLAFRSQEEKQRKKMTEKDLILTPFTYPPAVHVAKCTCTVCVLYGTQTCLLYKYTSMFTVL
jgi:hypothetical protein